MRRNIVEGEPGIFPDPIARFFGWMGRRARRLSGKGRLVGVHAVPWDRCEEAEPGRLRVTFYGSPHAGYGDVDRTEVVEEDDQVVVTLYVGNDPELEGPVTLEAAEQSVTVELSSPLGGRPVVDGAPR